MHPGQPTETQMAATSLGTTPERVSACGSSTPAPMPRAEAERRAALLKAVAEPARLQLLSVIGDSAGGEACVCDMADAVGLTQPTVSHHLKVLTDAGLLARERRGTWAWYAVVPERLAEVSQFLG
jgi:ArsR family transcriptional regulator, arsenate/arsenite/antimonite-responsive transcriptional repressor